MNPPPTSTDDIRPIRDLVTIPVQQTEPSYLPIVLWTILGFVALAVITALLVWLKRRSDAKRIPNLQQKALQQLTDSQSLITPGQSRAFSIAVSDILRGFIEARFYLPSTRRTTEEFLTDLSHESHIDLEIYQDSLNEFFHQCDHGKFSGDSLSSDEMRKLSDAVRDVVQAESNPIEKPPQS